MSIRPTQTRTKMLRMIEIGVILLAAFSLFGIGWTHYFSSCLTLSRIVITATNGCIAFLTAPARYSKTGLSIEMARRQEFLWIPAYVKEPSGSVLAIPLWILAVFATYLAFVFHRGCRRFRGRCQHCLYDLPATSVVSARSAENLQNVCRPDTAAHPTGESYSTPGRRSIVAWQVRQWNMFGSASPTSLDGGFVASNAIYTRQSIMVSNFRQ